MSNAFETFKEKLQTDPNYERYPISTHISSEGLPILAAGKETQLVITRLEGEETSSSKPNNSKKENLIDQIVPVTFDENLFEIIKSFKFKEVDGVPIYKIGGINHFATEILRYNSERLMDFLKSGEVFKMPEFKNEKSISLTYVFLVIAYFDEDRKTFEEIYDEKNNEIISPLRKLDLQCAVYNTSKTPAPNLRFPWDFNTPLPQLAIRNA